MIQVSPPCGVITLAIMSYSAPDSVIIIVGEADYGSNRMSSVVKRKMGQVVFK